MIEHYNLITHTHPKSPVSEAYRMIRTNIQYASIDKPLKCMVVTSSGPMEGKTTTISNLAVSFAQMGSKVLLIDADLRKPRIHKVFHLLNEKGLTNLLVSGSEPSEFIQKSTVPHLDVLTSGTIPPNPSELLNSQTIKSFVQSMRELYEVILLDAPPVGVVTDASIISTYMDGTLLVAKSGKVETDALKRAKEQLYKVNANIVGVILNGMDKKNGADKYYNTYYYQNQDEVIDKHRIKRQKK